jgi:hypothetical protein
MPDYYLKVAPLLNEPVPIQSVWCERRTPSCSIGGADYAIGGFFSMRLLHSFIFYNKLEKGIILISIQYNSLDSIKYL